jgi:hypothetical protein
MTVNQIGASQHDPALDIGGGTSTDGTPGGSAPVGGAANGAAGDTSDPDSATQQSGDTIAANTDANRITTEEVEAGGDAVGQDQPEITTGENSDESKSERSVGAETPADGTLG